jgi:hypothetical protein
LELDLNGGVEHVSYATVADASAAAGIDVRTPAWRPPGFTTAEIMGSPEGTARVTLKQGRLRMPRRWTTFDMV